MSAVFDDVIQRVPPSYDQVCSIPIPDSAPMIGYVHTLDQGNAIFITDDHKPYLITVDFADVHQLQTGDRLQARVTYDMDYNNYIVTELVDVQHVTYDDAPVVKPERNFTLGGKPVHLGTSVMIPVTDNADIATKVAQITKALPDNSVPYLLSFDGRPTNFDVPNANFTKPSYTSREKLMTCLLTFFNAKQQADTGKDVVLIIDSLDKMFTAFNNCMQSAGLIDPTLYSSAAAMDYESILCSSSQLKAGGSLTIIGLHHAGVSAQQMQITDRLNQIMDAVVEISDKD